MRKLTRSLSATLILLLSGPLFAQWIEYPNVEEGFLVNFPGEPNAEEIEWISEYDATIPARRYSVDSARGSYSVTVVDYRFISRGDDAQSIRAARVAHCPEGAETCLGGAGMGTGIGYWRVDMQGSMVYGAWQIMQRDAEVDYFTWNFTDLVEGLQITLTNPDQSRTYASLYLHDDRLYILEATTPEGVRGAEVFQQSLGFLDPEGIRIRYERYYHNSAPRPERACRDPSASVFCPIYSGFSDP
jgi:hypothetical protein